MKEGRLKGVWGETGKWVFGGRVVSGGWVVAKTESIGAVCRKSAAPCVRMSSHYLWLWPIHFLENNISPF